MKVSDVAEDKISISGYFSEGRARGIQTSNGNVTDVSECFDSWR
jgi:hypothetical protein